MMAGVEDKMVAKHTDNWDESSVGSVCMIACELCGCETGEIALKSKGGANAPQYDGPRAVRFKGARCEFCGALDIWLSNDEAAWKKVEAGQRAGVAKIVDKETGKQLAWLTFHEGENKQKTIDGELTLEHRMVLEAVAHGDGLRLLGQAKENLPSAGERQ